MKIFCVLSAMFNGQVGCHGKVSKLHKTSQLLDPEVRTMLMVISLAQMLLMCVKFQLLQVIKRDTFQMLTGYGDVRRLWSNINKGMFQAFTLVWQTAKNRCLHKTGGTYYQTCMYPTVLDWHFWCLFCFFYQYLAIFPMVSLYPQQKRAYSALHLQALTKCKSPIFPKIIYCALCYVISQCLTCYRRHQKCMNSRLSLTLALPF